MALRFVTIGRGGHATAGWSFRISILIFRRSFSRPPLLWVPANGRNRRVLFTSLKWTRGLDSDPALYSPVASCADDPWYDISSFFACFYDFFYKPPATVTHYDCNVCFYYFRIFSIRYIRRVARPNDVQSMINPAPALATKTSFNASGAVTALRTTA